MTERHPLSAHHNLCAGLVSLGWRREVANAVAFAFLLGRPLFINEINDCVKASGNPAALERYHQKGKA